MNLRITFLLTGLALFGVAIGASSHVGFAQSNLAPSGVFQLNLTKSKFSPGPAPKSMTLNYQRQGTNIKVTYVGIDAEGNPIVFMEGGDLGAAVVGGAAHPVTSPVYDSSAATRVDAYTVKYTRTKAGKVVLTGTRIISPDGKTLTFISNGINVNGQQGDDIAVYDKQ
jgi:hypothetical protein